MNRINELILRDIITDAIQRRKHSFFTHGNQDYETKLFKEIAKDIIDRIKEERNACRTV